MPEPKNKKFVAQKEKEERQKKIIIYGTAAILVIVLGLVAYGVLDQQVFTPNQPVVELEDRKVSTSEFKERVRYQRLQLINQAYQLAQLQQSLGSDPQMAAYFQQQLLNLMQQLQQPVLIGQQVVQSVSDELILLEEAEKRDISLSDQELDKEMEGLFGYYPEGTPTPLPTFEIIPTSTLTAQQMTLVPPTATPEGEAGTGGEEPQATSTPRFTPTTNPDPTATPLLKPTEYTEELYQQRYQETIDSLKNEADLSEETFRDMVRAFLIREKVKEQVTEDVKRREEQVWARHILVDEKETAEEVLEKLEEGEDFAALAAEYSTDSSNKDRGGNLGWFSRDAMVGPFAETAFTLDIGEISEPVETDFGWHIIQVLGHEERPLSENAYQQKVDQAFNTWLEEKRKEYRPQIAEDWMNSVPQEPAVPQELQQLINLMQQQQQQPQTAPTPAQ